MKPERPTASSVKKGDFFACRASLGEIACTKLAGNMLVTWKHEDFGHRLPNHSRWQSSVMRKLENEARNQGGQEHG